MSRDQQNQRQTASGELSAEEEIAVKIRERNLELRKNLTQLLVMPTIVINALATAVILYFYLLPDTANIFLKFNYTLPSMAAGVLKFSEFLRDYAWHLICGYCLVIMAFVILAYTTKGKYLISKSIIRLPLIGKLIRQAYIEIWLLDLHILYQESKLDLTDACRSAADACNNPYMKIEIRKVCHIINYGLTDALILTGVFTPDIISRLQIAKENHTLKNTALEIAISSEKTTSHKLRNAIDMVQIGMAMFIMIVMTLITIISSTIAALPHNLPN